MDLLEDLVLPSPSGQGQEEEPWIALEQEAQDHEQAGRWAEAAAAWRQLYAQAWRAAYERLRLLSGPAAQITIARHSRSRQEEKAFLAGLRIRPITRLLHRLPDGRDALGVITLAFSAGGEWLVTASEQGILWLWSVVREELDFAWSAHEGDIWGVAFSPDDRFIASVGEDGTAALWDRSSGEQVERLRGPGPMNAVAFSCDGAHLATGDDSGQVRIWTVDGGDLQHAWPAHEGPVLGLAFDPAGSLLATAGEDGTAALWNPAVPHEIRRLEAGDGAVNNVAFSPDGTLLAAGSDDGSVLLWNTATGEQTYQLQGHSKTVTGLAFSPDGSLLASTSADKSVRVWSAQLGVELFVLERHTDWVSCAAFSPDSTLLASGSYDQHVWLWLLENAGL